MTPRVRDFGTTLWKAKPRETPPRRAAVSWDGTLPSAVLQVWNQFRLAVAIWGDSPGDAPLGFCLARHWVRGKVDTEPLSLSCPHSFIQQTLSESCSGLGPEVEATGWNLGAKHPYSLVQSGKECGFPERTEGVLKLGRLLLGVPGRPHESLGGSLSASSSEG